MFLRFSAFCVFLTRFDQLWVVLKACFCLKSMVSDWRLGCESFCDPNREIDFGFGFVSCVTCVRAGEAKLRGSVRRRSFV
jgi:hypothetical protein